MRLSEHFVSAEFRSHDGAHTPLAWLRDASRLCTMYLEPLRRNFGPVTVVSGYRSIKHNADVGGASLSFHTRQPDRAGAAADVKCARGTPAQWYDLLNELGAPGLHAYDSWVHVDNRPGHARW